MNSGTRRWGGLRSKATGYLCGHPARSQVFRKSPSPLGNEPREALLGVELLCCSAPRRDNGNVPISPDGTPLRACRRMFLLP